MYDYYEMRCLLKETTTWKHEEIDSWDAKKLTAIFLQRIETMRNFLINNHLVTKEKIAEYGFKKLNFLYQNYLPLFIKDIPVVDSFEAKSVENSITSREAEENNYGEAEQIYTWSELLERYPELDGASRDYVKSFLLRQQLRILEDDYVAQPKRNTR